MFFYSQTKHFVSLWVIFFFNALDLVLYCKVPQFDIFKLKTRNITNICYLLNLIASYCKIKIKKVQVYMNDTRVYVCYLEIELISVMYNILMH